jgi:hypothetical protein
VARIALPLLAYFAIMWAGAYALGKTIGLNYARTTAEPTGCVHRGLRAGRVPCPARTAVVVVTQRRRPVRPA